MGCHTLHRADWFDRFPSMHCGCNRLDRLQVIRLSVWRSKPVGCEPLGNVWISLLLLHCDRSAGSLHWRSCDDHRCKSCDVPNFDHRVRPRFQRDHRLGSQRNRTTQTIHRIVDRQERWKGIWIVPGGSTEAMTSSPAAFPKAELYRRR